VKLGGVGKRLSSNGDSGHAEETARRALN
jgi:hypothetical protein